MCKEYCLREIERRDIKIINSWRNDPELIDFLGAPYRFINEEVDNCWYDNYMKNRINTIRCAIVEKDKDKILGLVSLTGIDSLNQCAEFHIMIGEKKNQGLGMGTFAVKEMMNHGFFNMNLQRIELSVLRENKRAIHLYEKCGFLYEGCKKKARYKNGKFVDLLMYAILREECCNTSKK